MSEQPVTTEAPASQGVREEKGLYALGYQNGLLHAASIVLEARRTGGNSLSVVSEILNAAEEL